MSLLSGFTIPLVWALAHPTAPADSVSVGRHSSHRPFVVEQPDVSSISGSRPSLAGSAWNTVDALQGLPSKGGIVVMYTINDPLDFPIDMSTATVTMRSGDLPAPTRPCTRVTTQPVISNATLGNCYFMLGGLGNDIYIWNIGAFSVGQHIRYRIGGLKANPGGTGTFQDFDSDAYGGTTPPFGPNVVQGRISARLVLVLDKSGSMAWSSHPLDPGCAVEAAPPPGCEPARWTVLKNAVNVMLQVAAAYSISVDQMAVAPFDEVVPPSALGMNFLTQDLITATSTLVNSTLSPGGWTAIGAGLEKYESQILPVPPNTRNQLVLLFTDGDQNRPPFVVFNGGHMQLNATPDLGGTPREYAAPIGTPAGNTDTAMVCPFALRADGAGVLGTVFIDGIASRRCKGMGMTKLTINPEEPALLQWFLQALNKALIGDKLEVAYVNRDSVFAPVPLPPRPFAGASASDSFTISARDRAFTILLTSANPNQKITPVYLTKDGQTFDLTGGSARPGIRIEQGAGFLMATLSAPYVSSTGKKVVGKGTWKIQIGQVLRGSQHYNLFVNVDNQTIASDFTAVQPTPGVGHPLVLTARLTEGGVPITGLPNGTVRAIVSRPGSGLGNVLSFAQIAPLPLGSNDTMNAAARKANAMLGNASLRPAILAALQAQPTPVTTLQELSGSPGTYQANYTATNVEGIYEVTFLADFQTSDNGRVTRTFSVTRYIPVSVDQPATQSTLVTTPISSCSYPGGCFSVTITPKDNLGNLAGPGKTPLLFIPPGQGVLLGPIVDNLNGSYTLRVGSTRPAGTPIVVNYGSTPINVPPKQGGGGIGCCGGLVVTLPYVGITRFQDTLHLKSGLVVGLRVGYPLANHLTVQADVGATFTKTTTNQSGRVIQLLGSLRWDMHEPGAQSFNPGVTVGVGYALFQGFGVNDEALLYQASAGATYKFGAKAGLRLDVSALRIADVFGVGATTNYQGAVGLVWWF